MSTADLIDGVRPRRKPRVLMQVVDAADGCEGDGTMVRMQCRKCKAETDWLQFKSVSEIRRGVPCKPCNDEQRGEPK